MKTIFTAIALVVALASPALAGNRAVAISGSQSSSSANNHNANISSNSNSNSNTNNNSNAGNNQSTSFKNRLQPGAIGLSSLASDVCHGSFSFGGGFPGGSLGLGFTTGDSDCRNAYLAQVLSGLGRRREAVQLMANEIPAVGRALQQGPAYPRGSAVGSYNKGNGARCNKWQGDVVGSYCIR